MVWLRSLLHRLRLSLSVLWHGLPKRNPEWDAGVVEIMAGRRPPGFHCPRCGERLLVSVEMLLAKSNLSCASCGLELKMTWQDDERARRTLERVLHAREEIERNKEFRAS
jgi:predicted RNA-binding Zn-ribbon protein involved in translation (DUF1610 family)